MLCMCRPRDVAYVGGSVVHLCNLLPERGRVSTTSLPCTKSSTNNLWQNHLLKQLSMMWSRVGHPCSHIEMLSLGRKHGVDLDVVAAGLLYS